MVRTDNSFLSADQIKRNLDRILEKVGVDESCVGDDTSEPVRDTKEASSPDLVTEGLLFNK